MSSRPIKHAVQCPVCSTWVADAPLCSWCTINMHTGSWVGSDWRMAARAVKRMPPSPLESGPPPEVLVDDVPVGVLWAGLIDDGREHCGKQSGYQVHRNRGEEPCEACREARRAYKRDLRARKQAERAVAA